jgi:Co/Zn/Cd efflux system component
LHHARSVKDLRIWAITPDRVILAVRVRTDGKMYHRNKMRGLKAMLQQRFGLADVYIESYEDELEEPQP